MNRWGASNPPSSLMNPLKTAREESKPIGAVTSFYTSPRRKQGTNPRILVCFPSGERQLPECGVFRNMASTIRGLTPPASERHNSYHDVASWYVLPKSSSISISWIVSAAVSWSGRLP
jgi:hypothetical protein